MTTVQNLPWCMGPRTPGADSDLHSHNFRGLSPTRGHIPVDYPKAQHCPVGSGACRGGEQLPVSQGPTHLPMHILAEAGGQALSPQDQVALVTKAIQQDVTLLILGISTVVYKGHDVSLQQDGG